MRLYIHSGEKLRLIRGILWNSLKLLTVFKLIECMLKIVTILTFMQFSGKSHHHTLH